jgi:hypothetical protein
MGIGFGIVGTLASGIGQTVEDICDGAGLPEPVGDVMGGALNMATGHYGDAIQDGIDLFSGDRGGGSPETREPAAPASGDRPFSTTVEQDFANMEAGIKPPWMKEDEWRAQQLQMKQQEYARMINLLTQMMTMQHESLMAIIRNIKS